MSEKSGVERVKSFLALKGLDCRIQELDKSTKSSALAALARGGTVAEIAKSVIFCGEMTAVLVIFGDMRVDPGRLNALTGRELRMASPDDVRARTGYVIGGVPPFPHNPDVTVLPDTSLTRFPFVWTASGAQNAVMRISTDSLIATIARPPSGLAQR